MNPSISPRWNYVKYYPGKSRVRRLIVILLPALVGLVLTGLVAIWQWPHMASLGRDGTFARLSTGFCFAWFGLSSGDLAGAIYLIFTGKVPWRDYGQDKEHHG